MSLCTGNTCSVFVEANVILPPFHVNFRLNLGFVIKHYSSLAPLHRAVMAFVFCWWPVCAMQGVETSWNFTNPISNPKPQSKVKIKHRPQVVIYISSFHVYCI